MRLVIAAIVLLLSVSANAAYVTVETTAYRMNLGNANTINIGVIGTVPLGTACKTTDKVIKNGVEYSVLVARGSVTPAPTALQALGRCAEVIPPPPVDCVVSEWSALEPAICPANGQQTRTATILTQPANGGTACPALTETVACTYTPPEPTGWVKCADEHARCAFTGTRTVRYGAGSTWTVREFVDGVQCDNEPFDGDPVPFVEKTCELQASVTAPPGTGSALLSWTPPTQNTDGSALTDLSGYRIHFGTDQYTLGAAATINVAGATAYRVEGLAPGTWYFAVKALAGDRESSLSAIAQKVIQ